MPVEGRSPWTRVTEVQWRNGHGPNCSYKGYPTVVFVDPYTPGPGTPWGTVLPTKQVRSDALPEGWVNLAQNSDGSGFTKGALGHFLIFTTDRDATGRPCPTERLVSGDQLAVTLPGLGTFQLSNGAHPYYEGPTPSSCDGRIAVTPLHQLQ